MTDDKDVKIKIVDGKMVVFEGDNPTEMHSIAMEGKGAENPENTLEEAAPEKATTGPAWLQAVADVKLHAGMQVGAVRTDKKHPYVVIIGGIPIFSSSSPLSDRLKALIAMGLPVEAVGVLNVSNGQLGIFSKEPKGE